MMRDEEISAILNQDISRATTDGSTLSDERSKAMDYYLTRPYGNEVTGRSQIMTSEVLDTIEWVMPQLMKIFTGSNDVISFEPVEPNDEEAAKQQTDYINYVFTKENDGFMILATWFKDALLQKNGIVKYFWEEDEKTTKETYSGLTEGQVYLLQGDDSIVIENITADMNSMGLPEFVVDVSRKEKKGKVCILCVPPEDFLIDPEYNSMDLSNVQFVAQRSWKTKEQLLDEGFTKAQLEDIRFSSTGLQDNEEEYEARFADIEPASSLYDRGNLAEVYECYKRIDVNNDGYAELRKITLCGKNILSNDEIDYIPFVAITPILMPHRFYGRSMADLVMDLQLQKSTLLRNIFDNMYLTNNARWGYVEGEVNIDQLLDSRPGSNVGMTAPGMVQPLATPQFPGHVYGMLEYMDSLKENRSGITRYTQGLDSNSLNKTATGVERIMDASQERVLMIARMFANGLKYLFLGIHRLLLQNMDQKKVIKLRGQWVEIDPQEWRDRHNMTINIGLGTGSKDQQINNLMLISSIQEKLMQVGLGHLVTPDNIVYTAHKLIEAAGYSHPEVFITSPEAAPPPPPPKPDPTTEAMMAQAQAEMLKAENDSKRVDIEAFEAEQKALKDQAEIQIKAQQAGLSAAKVVTDAATQSQRLALSKYQTDVKAQTDMEQVEKEYVTEMMKNDSQERINETRSNSRTAKGTKSSGE